MGARRTMVMVGSILIGMVLGGFAAEEGSNGAFAGLIGGIGLGLILSAFLREEPPEV